ncbi:hypothetical protein HPB48_026924 [Haemaphysalis longicornis]|uniref:Uncharacterized protein n=1 Tax=Haemaphysalis longicornis TaxID=44386 RepID=A0A9J6HAQ4_HAELO|nr:hypothetical protein HPB48_026924 [Haemaphysalis longicornis]
MPARILVARMMGATNSAVITFEALEAPCVTATCRIAVPAKAPETVADLFPLLVELIQAVNALGEHLQCVEDAQCRKSRKRPAPHHSSSLDLQPPNLDADSGSTGKHPAHLQCPTAETEDVDTSSNEFD